MAKSTRRVQDQFRRAARDHLRPLFLHRV